MAINILVVDDEPASRESLSDILSDEGYETAVAANGKEALAALETNDFDLVITDLRMPEMDGVELLKQIRHVRPQTLVILMTAYASVETAVGALREGAHDYMIKPLSFEDALTKIARLLESRQLAWQIQILRREVEGRFDFENLVGESAAMKNIATLIRKVAPTDSTVLITGESGVGKEVVARAVHHHSKRDERIFLPINCGAIPENLLESQLFGHVRGAFTGAITSQQGLFHRAKGGTIFLDEIGELPLSLQVKLLRVLEDGEVMPVGATEPTYIDVRIIAATNRDLEELCASGEFREDLYYRLNVFGIEIPPLRERREDIPVLVDFLVRRHNQEMNHHFNGVENAAMRILMSAPWKGNVRELDNVIEHAMILGADEWIRREDLPVRLVGDANSDAVRAVTELKSATRLFERNHVENVLGGCDGDKRAAADELGISLSSLYRKIEELGIGAD
jgi:two-component system response regulator PilR (NtrC family)